MDRPTPTESYFMLQIIGGRLPSMLAYQIHKGQAFVSPHTKAVDIGQGACLRSLDLANRVAAALSPVVRKRYGDAARIEVVPVSTGGGGASAMARMSRRIAADSAMLDARIAQRVFAPNKRPVMS
jgi:hypothetical protein